MYLDTESLCIKHQGDGRTVQEIHDNLAIRHGGSMNPPTPNQDKPSSGSGWI